MGFYDEVGHVKEYLKMCEGYDGRFLVDKLRQHLAEKSTLLELGMGPGKDLELLSKYFITTGSDSSKVFLELYKEKHPDSDVILVDAVKMNIGKSYDCLYSNKVLQHLKRDDLKESIKNQTLCLNDGGLILHSFWYGQGQEVFDGLLFTYYNEADIEALFSPNFEIISLYRYKEESEMDSVCLIARLKAHA